MSLFRPHEFCQDKHIFPDFLPCQAFRLTVPGQVGRVDALSAQAADLRRPVQVRASRAVDEDDRRLVRGLFPVRKVI